MLKNIVTIGQRDMNSTSRTRVKLTDHVVAADKIDGLQVHGSVNQTVDAGQSARRSWVMRCKEM